MTEMMSVTERLREIDMVDDEIRQVQEDIAFIADTEPDVVVARHRIYLKRLKENDLERVRQEMDVAMMHHINS